MRKCGLILLLCGAVSCGGDDGIQEVELLPGFQPTPPTVGEIQVITPILPGVQPGQDVTYCTYLDYRMERELDIVSYKGFQSEQGHHTILYGARTARPAGTHECTDEDMYGVRYLGGGGTDATVGADALPDGIAFRVPADTQLMMVSHWINASETPIDVQAAYNLTVQEPRADVDPGDLFTSVATNFTLPEGVSTVTQSCALQDDFKFFLIGGHAHEWATHITISHTPAGGQAVVIYDTDWDPELIFDTPLDHYTKEAPFTMSAGDTFQVDCTYDNTTGASIRFPTEMCVGFGYFFPADGEIDCVDGVWPQ
jgi:hypothetical protein